MATEFFGGFLIAIPLFLVFLAIEIHCRKKDKRN